MQKKNKGFTLIEMLVVVLIIGILAGIALPQYQMAVTKAKVASILPLMRRWKDALTEYKLQHGDYDVDDASFLGVNWPSDWNDGECGNLLTCKNDYWSECTANEDLTGYVYCVHVIDNDNYFWIFMYQSDEDLNESVAGMTICSAIGTEGEKVCKALGGKLLEDGVSPYGDSFYKLN